jgi:predicted dehydrogenase
LPRGSEAGLYSSSYDLIEREAVDFAFAFGRHSEMPAIAEALIARKIPFALEKPCGVNMAQVARLRKLAEASDVYCAIPFIFRDSDLLAAVKDAEGRLPSDFNYMSFRFIVGPAERYQAAGAGWALDPAFAGGGSTINVATHFIDFFRLLTGKDVARVSATMHARTHRGAVEDYSLVTMQTADGVVGLVETGYSFPSTADEQREFSFTLSSDRMYAKSGPDRIEIRDRQNLAAGTRSLRLRLETDVYYPIFVRRVLAECRSGAKPLASLRDAEAMMQVMDAAYASARQGGAPQALAPIPA